MKKHSFSLLFLLILFVGLFYNDSLRADSKIENWVQINQTFHLSDSLSFFAEIQPRISYSEGELSTLLARLAPIYVINSHHSIGGGFLWQPTFSPTTSNETRIFFQYTYNHAVGGGSLFLHRFRAEHRSINTTFDKAYRLRYQIRSLHSWFDSLSLKVLLANEIFFNLNTTAIAGPVSGFDQNRLILGFNYQWSKNLNSDIGYMYNYVRKPRSIEDRHNHIFYYALNATL